MKCWLGLYILAAWLLLALVDGCPDLPPVNYSIVMATYIQGGIQVIYNCIKGYHLVGKKELFCNNTSLEWNIPTPTCLLGHCPNPVLVNGQLNSSKLDPVSEGEVVTFKCNTGYILKGSNRSQCHKDHTWTPPLPMCITGKCTPPGKPAHGHFRARSFNSGSNVTYYCDDRYQLIGAQSLQCVDGQWSDQPPICEEITQASSRTPVESEKSCEFQKRNICETIQKWMQCQKGSGQTLEELKYSLEIKKLQLEKAKPVMSTEPK